MLKRLQGGKFNQFNLSLCKSGYQFAYNLFGYAKLNFCCFFYGYQTLKKMRLAKYFPFLSANKSKINYSTYYRRIIQYKSWVFLKIKMTSYYYFL